MTFSQSYGLRALLWTASALAGIVGACATAEVKNSGDGGTKADASALNGAMGGTCGFVMAACNPGDVSIGMNGCPSGRTCYLQKAGCTEIWCMTTSDAAVEDTDASN